MNESAEIIADTPRKRKELPPVEYIRECLDYDPITGSLEWKRRAQKHFSTLNSWSVWNSRFAGKEAGSKRTGKRGERRNIAVNFHAGTKVSVYTAHSLIFAIMGTLVPDDKIIDHRNTDPFDNRWENLRLVDDTQSACNRKKRNGGVNDLPKGIIPRNSGFQARIGINGKRFHLGVFKTVEEAHKAYCDAAEKLHGEFARLK